MTRNMGKDSVLAYFWDLVSLDQTVRVKAVVGLINQLKDCKDEVSTSFIIYHNVYTIAGEHTLFVKISFVF